MVRWNWSSGPRIMHNVTHVRAPSGFVVNVANANLWATAIANLITSSGLVGHLSVSTAFTGISLRDLRSVDQPFVDSTSGSVTGAAAGDPLPAQIAAVVTLRTALAGRANRGRQYLPPLDEASNDSSGRIATAAKTSLDSFATGWISAMSQASTVPAIVHQPVFDRTDCTVIRAPGVENITSVSVRDTRFDSQRRRAGRT